MPLTPAALEEKIAVLEAGQMLLKLLVAESMAELSSSSKRKVLDGLERFKTKTEGALERPVSLNAEMSGEEFVAAIEEMEGFIARPLLSGSPPDGFRVVIEDPKI